MIKGIESVMIGTENPKTLSDFYRETVGLKQTMEMEIGEKGESAFAFEMHHGASLYINYHSEVTGKNEKPQRVIFNLEVDDAEAEAQRLKNAGARLIQDTYHIQGYGLVATFADIDGNYFQIVQIRDLESNGVMVDD